MLTEALEAEVQKPIGSPQGRANSEEHAPITRNGCATERDPLWGWAVEVKAPGSARRVDEECQQQEEIRERDAAVLCAPPVRSRRRIHT